MARSTARCPCIPLMFAAAGILALLIGLGTAWQVFHPPAALPTLTSGTALPAPRPLTPFTLTDHQGKPFDQERLKGAWTFLFFGYTHCPDVCPTTLSTLNGVAKKLATTDAGSAPVRMAFVTVDPERDTVARLAEYVPYFNPAFIGLTGTEQQIDALAGQLNILHMRSSEPVAGGGYSVDHTASILLIDPQGRFTAIFSAPHQVAGITQDFLALRNYYESSR